MGRGSLLSHPSLDRHLRERTRILSEQWGGCVTQVMIEEGAHVLADDAMREHGIDGVLLVVEQQHEIRVVPVLRACQRDVVPVGTCTLAQGGPGLPVEAHYALHG